MPLIVEGVAEAGEAGHHLLGQAFDAEGTDPGAGGDALFQAQLAQEVFFLVTVQADAALDGVSGFHSLAASEKIEYKF